MLGYKTSSLAFLLYKLPTERKYTKFEIAKKSGGTRVIHAPIDRIKTLQRRLANILYACRVEIEREGQQRKPLSHGFRKSLSIITNAQPHKNRRYVLNLDIQDFFPSFNFGRVRGFFIKNRDFALKEKIATIIAQIACHDNALPQGSPCSPVIADMIAHLLDVRLAQLAKLHGATYSRYADDLTFSTNKKDFPPALGACEDAAGFEWVLGDDLVQTINDAGFAINPSKTRMQCRTGRQLVTGLTVNKKVNIRPEYYRVARAMCNSLFQTGVYHRGTPSALAAETSEDVAPAGEEAPTLNQLHGILSHIHYVKDSVDIRHPLDKKKNAQEKKNNPTAARKLYAKFLFYRYFVNLEQPIILCEGKTDNVYLRYAIRMLGDFHPILGSWSGEIFDINISFFNYSNRAHDVLGLGGGASDLKHFLRKYRPTLEKFNHRPLNYPVIVLIDNDDGAKQIFSVIKNTYNSAITLKSSELFFHVTNNLYLVKTPELGETGVSYIEKFFDSALTDMKLDGKKFNPDKKHGAEDEYGKVVFAEKVVRPNAHKIDFSKFAQILQRIVAVIDHYKPPA